MMPDRFKSDIITQDDIDAYKNAANVHGKILETHSMDILSMMPIISALHRNQVRTKGKLEF